MRAALQASLAQTPAPKTRETVMAELREQIHDQLEIAARSFLAGNMADVERSAGFAQAAAKAFRENEEELETMRKAAVCDASDESLANELVDRFRRGEKRARTALLAAVKKTEAPKKQKEAQRGSRV